jgi:plasmid stabilization system protein ParE
VTYPVRVRAEAQRDLEQAARWYESQRRALSEAFLDEFLNSAQRIGESPLAYSDVRRVARRVMLRRFPFGIYYRVAGEAVTVLAIMHASRDPKN